MMDPFYELRANYLLGLSLREAIQNFRLKVILRRRGSVQGQRMAEYINGVMFVNLWMKLPSDLSVH